MEDRDRDLLRRLLTEERILALGVLVDGRPYVGLLPFVADDDFTALLVHVSSLARHSRGMAPGARMSVLVQEPDRPDRDPLQLARVTLEGTVSPLDRDSDSYAAVRDRYIARFPGSARTFALGDFTLYRLEIERGRLVGGFARAATVNREILASLAG